MAGASSSRPRGARPRTGVSKTRPPPPRGTYGRGGAPDARGGAVAILRSLRSTGSPPGVSRGDDDSPARMTPGRGDDDPRDDAMNASPSAPTDVGPRAPSISAGPVDAGRPARGDGRWPAPPPPPRPRRGAVGRRRRRPPRRRPPPPPRSAAARSPTAIGTAMTAATRRGRPAAPAARAAASADGHARQATATAPLQGRDRRTPPRPLKTHRPRRRRGVVSHDELPPPRPAPRAAPATTAAAPTTAPPATAAPPASSRRAR